MFWLPRKGAYRAGERSLAGLRLTACELLATPLPPPGPGLQFISKIHRINVELGADDAHSRCNEITYLHSGRVQIRTAQRTAINDFTAK